MISTHFEYYPTSLFCLYVTDRKLRNISVQKHGSIFEFVHCILFLDACKNPIACAQGCCLFKLQLPAFAIFFGQVLISFGVAGEFHLFAVPGQFGLHTFGDIAQMDQLG